MNLTCLKSGIWQVELRIPSDVRVVLGRTRFAKSTGTRDKRQAINKALPILTEWQQLITTARENPELIQPKPDRPVCLHDAAQGLLANWHSQPWLDQLKPSQAKLYDAIEWGEGVSLPTHMCKFIEAHYTRHRTQLEARRYILEATLFIHTLDDLNRVNAQCWISTEELKPVNERRAVKTMQKASLKIFPKLELFNGWGIYAQNFEGQILKNVMLEGVKEGIVCLPVHDAVAVPLDHIGWACDEMRSLIGHDSAIVIVSAFTPVRNPPLPLHPPAAP